MAYYYGHIKFYCGTLASSKGGTMEEKTFAVFAKEKRERMGMAQKDVAKALGVHPSTINLWEKGKSTPRPNQHLKVAKLYRMTQDELAEYLKSSAVLGASEMDEGLLQEKERTVRLVHAATDFEKNTDINDAVENIVGGMIRDGWMIISAQTTMTMYYNERGFSKRTVQWCTTIVFER